MCCLFQKILCKLGESRGLAPSLGRVMASVLTSATSTGSRVICRGLVLLLSWQPSQYHPYHSTALCLNQICKLSSCSEMTCHSLSVWNLSCHLFSPFSPSKWACNFLCSMAFGICQPRGILIFHIHCGFSHPLEAYILPLCPHKKIHNRTRSWWEDWNSFTESQEEKYKVFKEVI